MKAAIVGGGLGGLASAILLAEKGWKVSLFERANELGGRARSLVEDGYVTNLGPHAVYKGGHAERVLTKLGGFPAGGAPKVRGLAMVGDTLHTLPTGPVSLLSTGMFSFGERLEAGRLMARIGSATARGDETVTEWLERNVEHERVRAMLLMYLRIATYTHPVGDLLAKDALPQLQMASGPGVRYLDGGWQTLVDGFRKRAEDAGVGIRAGAKVCKVKIENGAAKHLELEDGHVEAFDALVLAVGPKVASRLLPSDTKLASHVARLRPVEAACLDVAAGELVTATTALFGVDSPYYASVHSVAARLAPAGKSVIHVAKYLAPGETATEDELRAILERMQPGITIERARYLPRITVMNARVAAADGGIAGRISRSSVPNVGLVGDWVGDRGMLLDAVLASAEVAAEGLVAAGSGERAFAVSA